jgi:hypothetical protein
MLYDIEVRPGPDTGYFQYYTETVEANTSHDAIKKVERANRGCIVRCCASYNAPNNSSGGSSSSGDGEGTLAAIGILGTIALVMWAWPVLKWVLLVGAIGGVAYCIMMIVEKIKD